VIIKSIQSIDCQDLDELIVETYGRPFNFQQQDGCKSRGVDHIVVPVSDPYDYENDTIPEEVNGDKMGVSFAAWLARDPKQKLPSDDYEWSLDLFWSRNFYPNLDMVVNDLHARGLLPAGEYQIVIDW
jgi:hypothetical protein